jgi:predicted DCC family thiol-disulfide oxidoreductase YuxK
LWRIAFAIWLASHERLLGLIAVPIALGWYVRVWWAVLAAYWIFGFFWILPGGMMMLGLILAQLLVPGDPYLSLARRGAPDPGTTWRMPAAAPLFVLFSPLLEFARPLYVHGPEMLPAAIVFAALFCLAPIWIVRPRHAPGLDFVFYDGHCALCHSTVRYLMAEDTDGSRFRFAPLSSPAFESMVPGEIRRGLPDSVVVRTATGEVLTRYRAVQHALERLGGYWRIAGAVMHLLPTRTGDKIYNFIAARRYRVFGTKNEVCPLMPPTVRNRFEL